ncbi:Lactate dehydrogenase [Dendrosporobacter quercicolus]|uniref:Lactate dehydrogenase n=1 Tax=Dendrosporobacter quercicolus TaxID=146817 RepID=A0A1G9W1R3_9FIRM|nr:NAD(P)-dependent oxidoreductase [Dendrosporobacter quercicolus]SDM78482.1 Lactate dehydrogenase [Dendrosporobacter quercicolus]
MINKFKKMVAFEPTKLPPEWDQRLAGYARSADFYRSIPECNSEIIQRIGNADCVILSYTSSIDREVLNACPRIRYIGMCCSLYGPESANVDIRSATDKGVVVTGVRDYGDEGVKEYAISELVRLLHGNGGVMWKDEPAELTDLNIGIVGLGAVGSILARTFRFFGANIYYFSRTRKPEFEEANDCTYLPLDELLAQSEILITCLNKNVVLLGAREFGLFGSGKILMNTSISPSHEIPALRDWLKTSGNYVLSDTTAGLGEEIALLPNAFCTSRSAGLTSLAKQRLAQKVIANIEAFLSVSIE